MVILPTTTNNEAPQDWKPCGAFRVSGVRVTRFNWRASLGWLSCEISQRVDTDARQADPHPNYLAECSPNISGPMQSTL